MRRKIRLLFWFFNAFWKKYFKIIAIGSILGISVFYFYSHFSNFLPQPKKSAKIGLVGRYTTKNLPFFILKKISSGLVKIDQDGLPIGDLAETWEIKDEGKLYVFHLKKNIHWQDGSRLKAQDIHYRFQDVKTIAKDADTLEFKLKESFSPFPTLLNRPIFKKGLMGTGKYKVVSIKSNGKLVQSIKIESPQISITFKFYPTEQAAILGFKLGEVNQLKDITELADLKNWPTISISSKILQNQFVAVFYNTKDSQLSNKVFRQALTYAIPKPSKKSRAFGPINPHSWAYNSQVKPYNYDLSKAKQLLKKSKLEKPTIELITTFSQLPFAEKIKKSWQKLGIETKIKVVSSLPDNFQAFLASQEILPDPDQYTLWHSTQNTNITGYNNPKVDKLLEDGRKSMDLEKRKAIYLDFQRFLVEDAAAAFLFHPTVYTVSRQS